MSCLYCGGENCGGSGGGPEMCNERAPDFLRGARKAAELVKAWPEWKRELKVVGLRPEALDTEGQG